MSSFFITSFFHEKESFAYLFHNNYERVCNLEKACDSISP